MDAIFLETALRAADAAARVLDHYWEVGAAPRLKADRTPVTVADEEAERAIRETITATFPDHGFDGEEGGAERADAEFMWLIDPLDGTKSFIRRQPFFSTQLALLRGGARVLGVSNAPRFGERLHAVRGAGAWRGSERLAVSRTDKLAAAALSTGNLRTLAGGAGWAGLGRLVATVDRVRGYGDFYHYHQLAMGNLDIVLESDVNILDIAALATVIEEAGGQVTDMHGAAIGMDTTTILATNGLLHRQVLEELWN
jgi:histidinol-phosphatase